MGRRRGRSDARGIYVVNYSSVVQIYKLIPRDRLRRRRPVRGGETGGFSPQTGAPYGIQLTTFLNPLGMPCWKPPYGTMTAYDLKTGERLWNVPFGQVQNWGFYMPESLGLDHHRRPGHHRLGPDLHRRLDGQPRPRARPQDRRRCCGRALVDAPAVALPAVYDYKGKQYVVFVAGGNSILTPKVSDQVVAFALPD